MTDLFVIIRKDGPDSAQARKEHLQAHMAYSEENFERFMIGGPMRETTYAMPVGSVMIIKAESLDDARAFADEDPFAKAGAFASTEVYYFRAGLGEWIGGKSW